jgi:DNA end-binding protein Ku
VLQLVAEGNRGFCGLTVKSAMRAIWKGSISFGLVTIPVAMHTATRREELSFKLLRKTDMSPIKYKRVAEVDGKEVPWDDIVKGYEYEKGNFVVVTDEDFKRVDLKSTDSIEIVDFVEIDEIDPMYFDKPYYLEPQKGGAGAYALLRDVLEKTQKTGIAKVVIRTRQHLAAVKPYDKLLVVELMHFADELLSPEGLKVPETKLGHREEQMATMLVEQMTSKWEPERYVDEYKDAMMKVIEKKIEAGGKELPTEKHKAPRATNVIDLVEVLKKSLGEAGRGGVGEKKTGAKKKHAHPTKRRAAHHKKAA